jgi:hypothetical protein
MPSPAKQVGKILNNVLFFRNGLGCFELLSHSSIVATSKSLNVNALQSRTNHFRLTPSIFVWLRQSSNSPPRLPAFLTVIPHFRSRESGRIALNKPRCLRKCCFGQLHPHTKWGGSENGGGRGGVSRKVKEQFQLSRKIKWYMLNWFFREGALIFTRFLLTFYRMKKWEPVWLEDKSLKDICHWKFIWGLFGACFKNFAALWRNLPFL